jgi:hypothetical protein
MPERLYQQIRRYPGVERAVEIGERQLAEIGTLELAPGPRRVARVRVTQTVTEIEIELDG